MNDAVDILILSNGPGELTTWVKPVVQELRQQLGHDHEQVRISVVLSPCANASGQEVAIARRFPEVDRVQGAEAFFPFLLTGKTAEPWDWRDRGVVLFLGGDQIFPIVIGKRLGYRIVIYAEWEARWHRWGDRFGVMQPAILQQVAPAHAHKFTVVGDLMAEAGKIAQMPLQPHSATTPQFPVQLDFPIVGLLPGSKPMKLTMGVPLTLAIAEHIYQQRPDVQFIIPVAPSLDLSTLATYADPQHNPVITRLGWGSANLQTDPTTGWPTLYTASGVKIFLWTNFPAYDLLIHCQICLTTLGANTAELGALAIPMLVLVPTQQLDIMRAWDGIPGILANLPGVGHLFATLINWIASLNVGLMAWPNIWAKREIVPELVGRLEPIAIANQVLHYLDHPEALAQMRQDLQNARGQSGAAAKLVDIVKAELSIHPQRPS